MSAGWLQSLKVGARFVTKGGSVVHEIVEVRPWGPGVWLTGPKRPVVEVHTACRRMAFTPEVVEGPTTCRRCLRALAYAAALPSPGSTDASGGGL